MGAAILMIRHGPKNVPFYLWIILITFLIGISLNRLGYGPMFTFAHIVLTTCGLRLFQVDGLVIPAFMGLK